MEKELPAGWGSSRIADLVRFVSSGSRDWAQYYADSGAKFIRIGNLKRGTITIGASSIQHVSLPSTAEGTRTRLCEGDILVSITAALGFIGVVPPNFGEAYINQHVAVVRLCAGISPAYVAWFLAADHHGGRQLLRRSRGATKVGLGLDDVTSVEVPIPSRKEQDRIVAAIEQHLSDIDAGMAALERALANLRRYRASVLKAACEGKLVPTEAELARKEARQYESANVLVSQTPRAARPNRYDSRTTDVIPGHAALSVGDTQEPLPEGWVRAPMVEVARMESGHTPSRNHPEWWDGDIPWIGIVDAREHHGGVIHDTAQHTNEAGIANSAARLLPGGTVCISRTASVGYVVVMGRTMATSQDFVDWICTAALDPHWVRIVFLADREALLRFGKGTVHKTIYFPELLSLHIAIPPLAEQHRIVAEVDRLLSVADETETAVRAQLARAERLRQAVLARAFEGKLVPQDPADEPAAALLERLRAERAAAPPPVRKPGPRRRKAETEA